MLTDLDTLGVRTYISEPDRGRRNWRGNAAARQAVYANRRRIKGARGQALRRRRGELLERTFAHTDETGGMRRTHLRGHGNILKRLLVHAGGFNLGLVMRALIGVGTPRGLQGRLAARLAAAWAVLTARCGLQAPSGGSHDPSDVKGHCHDVLPWSTLMRREIVTCATGC